MAFLNALSRNGIWVSIPLFIISIGFLVFSIIGLVRLGAATKLASLPLLDQQPVQFTEAGRVVLAMEGPRLSRRFSDLTFDLVSPAGTSLAGSKIWVRSYRSGVSIVQVDLLSFTLPAPGQYLLRISNLGSNRENDNRHRVVFSRPHLPRTIGYILGIILSAGFMIGSIVLFILRLVNKGGAS